MAEKTQNAFNDGVQKTLSLKSDQWGIFGSTFKTKIPVTDLGDGLYKITKNDWDTTIGPVFDRMRENVLGKDHIDPDKYRSIAHGYLAMDNKQVKSFHQLLCSFGAAADPKRLSDYPGTVETNDYLAKLTNFADMLNGSEGSVLVSGSQLQGLANAARSAMEYAHEGRDVSDGARDFYAGYEDKRRVHYSNGLVNTLS